MSPDCKPLGVFSAAMAVTAKDLRKIARISKSNGTDGEVSLTFFDFAPQDIDLKEPVFIFFDGLPVPFLIQAGVQRGSRLFVRLNDVCSLADAEELVGRDVFVRTDSLAEEDNSDEALSVDDLMGWSLTDADGHFIGEIVDYEDIPGNPCLYVRAKGKTAAVMVPLHDDLIDGIDPSRRTLHMHLPEGLI